MPGCTALDQHGGRNENQEGTANGVRGGTYRDAAGSVVAGNKGASKLRSAAAAACASSRSTTVPAAARGNSAAGIVRRQHGQDQKKAKDVSGKFLRKEKLGSLQEHRVSSRGHGFIQGVASWHVPERRSQERGT
mmetsp:Transcript_23603/g.41689  ORF Transcript_23603/g.41689 Transcript_23603/m.41689 type:complete len:134 (+) Transcript_23603:95-496(+)